MRIKTSLICAGAILLASFAMVPSASADTFCVPFNMYWNECTTTTWNPHTGQWETQITYEPVRTEESIDP